MEISKNNNKILKLFILIAICLCSFFVVNFTTPAQQNTYAASEQNYYNITQDGTLTYYNGPTSSTLSIPAEVNGVTVKRIGQSVFRNSTLPGIILPSTVTELGDYCFYGSSISSIQAPNVETIGNYAFQNTTRLTNVSMSNAKTIGNYAFQNSSNLHNVTFPYVTKIGDFAFQNTLQLTSAQFNNIETIGISAFENCGRADGNTTIHLSSRLQSIGESAFANNHISSFWNSGGSIGNNFTINDSNIIRKSDYKVVALAFGNGQKNFYFDSFTKGFAAYALKGSCKTLLIDATNGVVQFENYAFDSATIENLNISASTCRFMDLAFCNAKITNFTLDSEYIDKENNRTFQAAQIQQLNIGERVSSIPSDSFYGLKIKRVVIESSSTNISNYSFNLSLWDNPSFKLEALILNFATKEESYYQSLQYAGLVPNVASIYIPDSVIFIANNPLSNLGYTRLLTKDGYKIFSKAGGIATVTATAGTGATISPSETIDYIKGETVTYNIQLSAGYKITSIIVDGTNTNSTNITSYTFKNISSGQHTIVVNTEKLKYTMFVSNGEGGTVSPNEIVVEYGSSLTFTVTPNPGYKIKAVTYQTASSLGTTYGNPVTPENLESFTISNIKANYKIVATFEKLSYTIDVTVGTGGLVSPTGAVITVNHGDNKTFTFTPDEGYEIEDVLVNSTSVGTDATYTFTNITQNHTLEVIFKQSSYTLTYNLNYPGCSNTTQTYTYQQTISAIADPARTNYSFAGWYTEAECINPYTFTTMPAKDVEVFAKWNINTYTITWLNYNNAVLGTSTVAHGSTPQYPYNTPVKDSTEQYVYEFTGWDPELVEATESTSYTAVFTESIRQYTVSFYSDNGRLLKEVLVNYGTTVIYGATNPEKEATAQYSYTFDKWVTTQNGDTEVDLASITQDTKAYAKFTETVRKYTIVFANYDNTVLQSEELEYGQTPVYKGQTPTRPDENTVVYTFSGWNKEIATVTGNVTYIAVYNVSGKFTVNFYLDDGRTILEQCYITPGESASFTLGTPEKEATAQYTYEFVKWVTTPDGDVEADLSNITQNTSIYAKFNQVLRSYIITFVNYNDEILQSEELEYGSTPEYTKNTPQRPATNEYTYTFTGWDPKIEAVSGNQTYKAIFSQTEVYTVEFLSDDGLTVLHTEYVSKNTAAVYDVTPTKQPTAQYSYTFDKWVTTLDGDVEADLSNIIQNTRVYAKFTPVINKYTVTFVNYDDTVLQQGDYSYGDTPEYTGETPTRPATNEHSYSFIGWTPGISPVINDITYTARYSQSDKYVVTFYSEDGSTILDQCFVGYGEKATYNGSTPEKVKTAEFSYKFNKWVTEPGGNIEDKLTDVVKSRNVYASFTPVKNKYTVKFVNFDGTELKSETLDYGAKPLYNIALPERPATAQFTYEFIGWSPEIDFVTADAIYTAIYNEIINQYTITVKVGKNGVVSPGSVTLDYGQTQVFSITPNEHYEISKITLDGVLVAPNSTIEIPNINQNHTLNVEFAKITFMITTTTDENGRITPSTSVEITGTHRIDFYPDEGYDIKDVKVDNVSIGIVPYYTFVSINQHHTISVEYKIKEYSVTMHIDGKGVVSPINTISVNHGDEIIVTLTPEGGWEILKLYVNGESYTVKNNQVVIPCINEDLQIQAVFTLIQSDGSIGTTIVVIAAIIAGLAVCLVFAYLLIKYVKGNKTEEKGFDDLTKNLQKLNKNKPENNNTEEQNNTKAQAKPAPKAVSNNKQAQEEILDPRIKKAQDLKHENDLFIQNIKNLQKKPAPKPAAPVQESKPAPQVQEHKATAPVQEHKVITPTKAEASQKVVAQKPVVQPKVEPVQKQIPTPQNTTVKQKPVVQEPTTIKQQTSQPKAEQPTTVKPVAPQKPLPAQKPAVVETKPEVKQAPVVEHKPEVKSVPVVENKPVEPVKVVEKEPVQEIKPTPVVTEQVPAVEETTHVVTEPVAVETKKPTPTKMVPPARPPKHAPKIPVRKPFEPAANIVKEAEQQNKVDEEKLTTKPVEDNIQEQTQIEEVVTVTDETPITTTQNEVATEEQAVKDEVTVIEESVEQPENVTEEEVEQTEDVEINTEEETLEKVVEDEAVEDETTEDEAEQSTEEVTDTESVEDIVTEDENEAVTEEEDVTDKATDNETVNEDEEVQDDKVETTEDIETAEETETENNELTDIEDVDETVEEETETVEDSEQIETAEESVEVVEEEVEQTEDVETNTEEEILEEVTEDETVEGSTTEDETEDSTEEVQDDEVETTEDNETEEVEQTEDAETTDETKVVDESTDEILEESEVEEAQTVEVSEEETVEDIVTEDENEAVSETEEITEEVTDNETLEEKPEIETTEETVEETEEVIEELEVEQTEDVETTEESETAVEELDETVKEVEQTETTEEVIDEQPDLETEETEDSIEEVETEDVDETQNEDPEDTEEESKDETKKVNNNQHYYSNNKRKKNKHKNKKRR